MIEERSFQRPWKGREIKHGCEQVNDDVTGVRRFSGWTFKRHRRMRAFISAAADSASTCFKSSPRKSASLMSLLESKMGNGAR